MVSSNHPGSDSILQCRNFAALVDAGFPPNEIRDVLRQRDHYRVFTIPKANGTERIIEDPSDATREVLHAVRLRYHELGLDAKLSRHAVGFRPNRSVMSATDIVRARFQGGSSNRPIFKTAWVATQDLSDAFHSISERQVNELLRKHMDLNGFARRLATRAMTRNGRLAVGSPASPEMLNLYLIDMDKRIFDLCTTHGIAYARYADDLTFFGEHSHQTANGNRKTTKRSWWTWFLNQVREIIKDEGMTPHAEKSALKKVSGPRSEPSAEVLGHTVRGPGKTAPTRETKRRARAARHRFRMAGFDIKEGETGERFLRHMQEVPQELREAQGLLAWLYLTEGRKPKAARGIRRRDGPTKPPKRHKDRKDRRVALV